MQFDNLNFSDFDINLIKGVISQSEHNLFDEYNFIEENFHEKQKEFLRLKQNCILMVTGKRPGKTYALSGKIVLIDQTVDPGTPGFIVFATSTMGHAHELMYHPLMKWNKKYKLGWDYSQYKKWGIIMTPNKNIIRFMGLHDSEQYKKAQGLPFKGILIDECQMLKSIQLENFDNEVGMGRVDFYGKGYDHGGQMIFSANPPKVHIGHLTKLWKNAADPDEKTITRFQMNIMDNPFYTPEQVSAFFDSERKRLGLKKGQESAAFRRHAYGEWAEETETRIYNIKPDNIYTKEPQMQYYKSTTVMGVDMGYHHKDAIAVLKYDHSSGKVYCVYEWEHNKLSFTELANQIKKVDKMFKIDIKIADFGGLGKKAQKEFLISHNLYMIAAKKQEKMVYVEKLKDLIVQKRIFFKPDSIFIKDAEKIEYDDMFEKIQDKHFHSDIHDAVLYATRHIIEKYNHRFKTLEESAEEKYISQIQQRIDNLPKLIEEDRYLLETLLPNHKKPVKNPFKRNPFKGNIKNPFKMTG